MTSEKTAYYAARAEKLYWLNREHRAERYLGKNQQKKDRVLEDFGAILFGSIIVLLISLLATR